MTATLPEIGTIEHLDFEFAPACESKHSREDNKVCGGVAVWANHAACGCFQLVCDEHRRANLARAATHPKNEVSCPCGGPTMTWVEWVALSTWTPIGRG